jgi:hypothetical protein
MPRYEAFAVPNSYARAAQTQSEERTATRKKRPFLSDTPALPSGIRRHPEKPMRLFVLFLISTSIAFAAEKDFRVLTYNVGLLRALGEDIVKDVAARAEKLPKRVAAFANDHKVDVILLREVWEKGRAAAFTKELGKDFAFRWPKNQVSFGNTSGLLLAVRKTAFRLDDKDGQLRPFESNEKAVLEKLTSKGILIARLQPAEDSTLPAIGLAGTHIQ